VGDGADAGGLVDPEADIPLACSAGLPRVQPHADAHLDAIRPGMAFEGALSVDRARHRVARARERHEERVSLRIDLAAAMCLEALAEDPLVVGQQLAVPVAEPLDELRRSLDVGEEQRDRARWKLVHRRSIARRGGGIHCHCVRSDVRRASETRGAASTGAAAGGRSPSESRGSRLRRRYERAWRPPVGPRVAAVQHREEGCDHGRVELGTRTGA
jgi:hypothetical protein